MKKVIQLFIVIGCNHSTERRDKHRFIQLFSGKVIFRDIKFHSIQEVERAMGKAVEFFNNERPHMSLGNMTPRQAASCKGKIDKKWVSYREKYLENLEISEGATTFAAKTLNSIESGRS